MSNKEECPECHGIDDMNFCYICNNTGSVPAPNIAEREELLQPIEKPIGDFILSQSDIIPVIGGDGAYYHYADVCKLLNRLKPSGKVLSEEEKYSLVDELSYASHYKINEVLSGYTISKNE